MYAYIYIYIIIIIYTACIIYYQHTHQLYNVIYALLHYGTNTIIYNHLRSISQEKFLKIHPVPSHKVPGASSTIKASAAPPATCKAVEPCRCGCSQWVPGMCSSGSEVWYTRCWPCHGKPLSTLQLVTSGWNEPIRNLQRPKAGFNMI